MCIFFSTLPLLLDVGNRNSAVDAEMIWAVRVHLTLLCECLEIIPLTPQPVGDCPSPPCALLLALKEFSSITELTVSHRPKNSQGEVSLPESGTDQ